MGTLDNLIEKLVDKGILTREEASKMYEEDEEEEDDHLDCAEEALGLY